MDTVVITGGSGMIGTAVTRQLIQEGYKVCVLTRGKNKKGKGVEYVHWDPAKKLIPSSVIENAGFIIHLAGANVAEKRWTRKRKDEILQSRVQSGELLVHALRTIPNKVKAIVSASAIGFYGPDQPGSPPFTETDPPIHDFLSTVVQKWETAIQPAANIPVRTVILRTGIVLSREGGAYEAFRKPMQFRTAVTLGNGKQVVSWIHIHDLVRIYIMAMQDPTMQGIYNAVSPGPVTNRELIRAIASCSGFLIPLTVPSFLLKMALGELSVEVLKSTTVSSEKIIQSGFAFQYPDVHTAVRNLEGISN